MIVPMAVEAFEDNLFFAAWTNVAKPRVEELLDNIYGEPNKNDWVNSALRESTEFVIQMMSQMGYMAVIRNQDKVFEIIGKVYRRLKAALLKKIGDFFKWSKEKIKGKRGVVAQTLFNNHGKGGLEHIEAQKLQAMEINNITQQRIASASSISTLEPAAKSVDFALNKKTIHADLAYKRGKLMFDGFESKAMLGAFSASDVTQFKKISSENGGGTQNLQLDDLNRTQGVYMSQSSNGTWMGNAQIELAMLSYYGYHSPAK